MREVGVNAGARDAGFIVVEVAFVWEKKDAADLWKSACALCTSVR